jgi:hypothetical protein
MSNQDAFGPIERSEDGRYLIVSEKLLPTVEELQVMLAAVVAAAKQEHLSHILYDARAMNTPFSLTQAFNLGEVFAAILPPTFRLAILIMSEFPNRRFLEMVAVNRYSHLKYFTDREQAIAWLFA